MAKDFSRIATLAALRGSGDGGRASISVPDAAEATVAAAYRARIADYAKQSFWNLGDGGYRPERGLRLPQRRAVAFAQAYLAARSVPQARAEGEAALIKMPTGTGKSGVIAALACASPGVRKTLILTPRASLVRQMGEDLTYRFWSRLDARYTRDGLQTGADPGFVNDEVAEPKDMASRPVRRLVSEQYRHIMDEADRDRQIWVGTFNALHLILGVKPPAHRDFQGREERAPGAVFDPDKSGIDLGAFRDLIKSVDLVIVDEGHHEPAFSWSQAVRALNKPTIIFSATPYRNDYKYFQVTGRFVFSLPWEEAVSRKLVRQVEIAEAPDSDGRGSLAEGEYSPKLFAEDFKACLEALPADKKAIIHATNFATLKALQRALFEELGEAAVLIHDNIKGKEKDNPPDLAKVSERTKSALKPLRFGQVHLAVADDLARTKRLWLHQFKLLEGVDDPAFIEIWLYDDFGSARQLVQQIGRAIRLPSLDDPQGQTAIVRGCRKRLARFEGEPTIAARARTRWEEGYKALETYAVKNPDTAFTAETQLLATLKKASPGIQYVAGEFRSGHLLSDAPTMKAFMVPCRGTVCRVRDIKDADDITPEMLSALAADAAEAMLLEDRFDIVPVTSGGEVEHEDARLIRYLAWRNSPYLTAHQIPEWTLGLLLIVKAGRYVFMLDTEGNCLDLGRLKLVAPEPEELKRLFATDADGASRTVRIVETTAKGLDVSELGLRSISVRRHALDNSYFDLAESSQAPTTIIGYSPFGQSVARRRLSLSRSNLTDATNRHVSIRSYVEWARQVAAVMADTAVTPHAYFNRFARELPPLDPQQAAPRSILLDLADLFPEPGSPQDQGWNRAEIEKVLKLDTCCEVEARDVGGKPVYVFEFAGHPVEVKYVYRQGVPPYGRYQLSADDLNADLTEVVDGENENSADGDDTPNDTFGRRLAPSLTRLLNAEQAFQIVTAEDGAVYSHGHFYSPQIDLGLLSVLEGDTKVVGAVSEKGDTRVDDVRDWNAKTLFGLVEAWSNSAETEGLAGDLAACDILICDDSNKETADFYAVDETRKRVLIIHAKAAETANPSASAGKLQEVARQAQASLALAGSSRQAVPPEGVWNADWSVRLQATAIKPNPGQTIQRPRLWKAPGAMTITAARERLIEALADPTFRREVVIQTAGLLSHQAAKDAFANRGVADQQFIYFLASVRTSFDRAGVRLRIVCNP
jgi:hypothetical protein